jgi:hypothetical protein
MTTAGGGLTTTAAGGFITVFLVTVLDETLGATGAVVTVVSDSVVVWDQPVPAKLKATAKAAAGIQKRSAFIVTHLFSGLRG